VTLVYATKGGTLTILTFPVRAASNKSITNNEFRVELHHVDTASVSGSKILFHFKRSSEEEIKEAERGGDDYDYRFG
jgi:hypothetical protein